jgi:hypothetical protein
MARLKNNELTFGNGAVAILSHLGEDQGDCNDWTSPGFHSGYKCSNSPVPDNHIIVITLPVGAANPLYVRQLALGIFPPNSTAIWSRICDGGTWSNWSQIIQ